MSALEPFHRMALTILRHVVDEGREEDIGISTTAVVIDAVDVLDAEVAELTTQRDLAREVAVALEQEVAQLVHERDQDAADLRAATADLRARLDSIVEEHRRRTIGTFCLSCMGACRFAADGEQ